MKKLNLKKVLPLIQMAIKEDLGAGDLTSELFYKDDQKTTKAHFISREEIVVCGMSIGYRNPDAPENIWRTGREPVASFTRWFGFEDG